MIIGVSTDIILAVAYILVGFVIMTSILKLVHAGILLPENFEKSDTASITLTDTVCILIYWIFLAAVIGLQVGVFVISNSIMPVTLAASIILLLDLAFYRRIEKRLDPDKLWDSFVKDVLRIVVPISTSMFILIDGFFIIFAGRITNLI